MSLIILFVCVAVVGAALVSRRIGLHDWQSWACTLAVLGGWLAGRLH